MTELPTPDENRPSDPLTVKEVAAELGVSDRRVRQYLAATCLKCRGVGCYYCEYTGQRLPGAYKVGWQWLIPRRALHYLRVLQKYRKGWKDGRDRQAGVTETEGSE